MDTTNCTLEAGTRQDVPGGAHQSEPKRDECLLTPSDRRLLLGASLRLLAARFSHGRPIFQSDVIHVSSLCDDAAERAA